MPRPAVPTLVDADGPVVVTLRAHHDDDIPRVLEQCADPASIAWTTVPVPYTRDDAARFVRHAMPGGWANDEEWAFAVDVDGRFGGTVSLRNRGDRPAEIAYGAHPDVRGTGAMERAVRLLLEWGFAERCLPAVDWWANRGNWASLRLAWKVGFDIAPAPVRGYLDHRGVRTDAWLGVLLATDYRAPRTPWLAAPRIESPRLPIRLRELRESDADRHVAACRDPETAHWLGGIPDGYDEASFRTGLLEDTEHAASGSGIAIAVADRDDDRLVGRISVFDLGGFVAGGEIGYWVHPAERGRGVAGEMVRLVVRHALLPTADGGLGLTRLRAHAATDNTASLAVLATAGFRRVGVERSATRTRRGPADAVLWEILSSS